MPQLYLSLGSNEGDREALLHQAIDAIDRLIGAVGGIATFIETEPWGFESPHPFLNTALVLTTSLSPLEVLDRTQEIERQLGRQRKSVAGHYHDRPISIRTGMGARHDMRLAKKHLTELYPYKLFQDNNGDGFHSIFLFRFKNDFRLPETPFIVFR